MLYLLIGQNNRDIAQMQRDIRVIMELISYLKLVFKFCLAASDKGNRLQIKNRRLIFFGSKTFKKQVPYTPRFPLHPHPLLAACFFSFLRISFQTATVHCPAVRLFSLVLVTPSDCSGIHSHVSLHSTHFLIFLNFLPYNTALFKSLEFPGGQGMQGSWELRWTGRVLLII